VISTISGVSCVDAAPRRCTAIHPRAEAEYLPERPIALANPVCPLLDSAAQSSAIGRE
jgi:hypothetical protein